MTSPLLALRNGFQERFRCSESIAHPHCALNILPIYERSIHADTKPTPLSEVRRKVVQLWVGTRTIDVLPEFRFHAYRFDSIRVVAAEEVCEDLLSNAKVNEVFVELMRRLGQRAANRYETLYSWIFRQRFGHVGISCSRLTFDLSGLPKAGPLEGRVRRQVYSDHALNLLSL